MSFNVSHVNSSAPALAVEVGFDQQLNFVNESVGSYQVCVFLSGQIERNVSVEIIHNPTNSPGKSKSSINPYSTVTEVHYTYRFRAFWVHSPYIYQWIQY